MVLSARFERGFWVDPEKVYSPEEEVSFSSTWLRPFLTKWTTCRPGLGRTNAWLTIRNTSTGSNGLTFRLPVAFHSQC